MVLLLVFMQLTRDLFAIAKFCYTANTSYLPLPRKAFTRRRYRSTTNSDNSRLIAAYYSFIDPERMKGWVGLVGAGLYSGLFTHINGYLSAAGPVQAREGSPVRDRRSTTKLHHKTKKDHNRRSSQYTCGNPQLNHFEWVRLLLVAAVPGIATRHTRHMRGSQSARNAGHICRPRRHHLRWCGDDWTLRTHVSNHCTYVYIIDHSDTSVISLISVIIVNQTCHPFMILNDGRDDKLRPLCSIYQASAHVHGV